jgi:hypothetical protein
MPEMPAAKRQVQVGLCAATLLQGSQDFKEGNGNALLYHMMAVACIFFSIELIKPSHNEAFR